MTDVLHVVFTPSGAGDLREALAQAGRSDRVVAFFDNLSFGPIEPSDLETRAAWVEAELRYADWSEIAGEITTFWAAALSTGGHRSGHQEDEISADSDDREQNFRCDHHPPEPSAPPARFRFKRGFRRGGLRCGG